MHFLYAVSHQINKKLLSVLNAKGDVVLLTDNPYLPGPEAAHADMQIADVSDELVFIKKGICDTFKEALGRTSKRAVESKQTLSGIQNYPDCCTHNILICGNYYFHRLDITDPDLKAYLASKFFIPVNVRQGYSGCSSCYIDSLDLIITSDSSVAKASSGHSFNCLVIEKEITKNIILPGYDHGFIGGCMGYCRQTNELFVNGALSSTVPDLYALLRSAGITVYEVENEPLCDIGGIKCIVYK